MAFRDAICHRQACRGKSCVAWSPFTHPFMLRSFLFALVGLFLTFRAEAVLWSVYAGADGGPGAVDNTGTAARLNRPFGVAVDVQGNAYVTEVGNGTIRRVTPAGAVTTLAGTAGLFGHVDGVGAAARFGIPRAVALRPDGSLVVTDFTYLRAVALDGTVTTLAGSGSQGAADGPAAQASFTDLAALAVDGAGNIYMVDGKAIRVLTVGGQVMTVAGSVTQAGDVDDQGTAARFEFNINGLTLGPDGNLYVADNVNRKIRQVTPTGAVTTYASPVIAGPILADANGDLYISGGESITKVDAAPGHAVTLVAGGNGNSYVDGPMAVAQFNGIFALAFTPDHSALLAAELSNHAIRKIALADGAVSTLAGKGIVSGSADGTGTAATFFQPSGLGVDAAGNVYVADTGNFTIRQIAPGAVVTTWAGQAGMRDTVDDTGTAARFKSPYALAAQADGTLYITDVASQLLRKITPQQVVSTLAGTPNTIGSADGLGLLASFYGAYGVGVAPAGGTIAVGDTNNYTIRTVTPQGLVGTLAGMVGQQGAVDATGLNASFGYSQGVAVDAAGNVFVADLVNYKIRKVTSGGVVTTLAGSGGFGLVDGVGVNALFNGPTGVAVDAHGNVFVTESGFHAIRKVTPSGRVITLGGGNQSPGATLGVGTAARFNYPVGIAVAADGTIYVSDGNQRIVKGVDDSTEPPFLTAPLADSATSSPVTVTYELTEAALSGSVSVKFAAQNVAAAPVILTLTAAYATPGVHTFSFNPASPVASAPAAIASISGGTSVPDAIHTVTLSYQDALSHPATTAVATNVKIDTATQTPSLTTPLNQGTLSTALSISGFIMTLPEPALAGSVKLTLSDGVGAPHVLTLGALAESAGQRPVRFDPSALPYAGSGVNPSVSGSPVSDGTYTVTLSYQDVLGNPAATASQPGVIVDTVTQAPTFTKPEAHSAVSTLVTATFTLPEAPAFVQLTFTNANNSASLVFEPTLVNVGTETTVFFDPRDPVNTSSGAITSGTAIPDGVYSVKLSYRDVGLNALVSVTHTNVQVDTTAPTFNLPQNGIPVQRTAAGTLPDYTGLISTTDATTVTVMQSPSPFTVATYTGQPITVTLTAMDAVGNISTTNFKVDVRPADPINTVIYNGSTKTVPGDDAPGAGITPGLPGDAKLASFGPPAIDEDGTIAFLAKWTSATGPLKKGAGIFVKAPTTSTCVATLGGDPPLSGASYKSFLDPVISHGKVAFIATLTGVPKGQESVILSDAPTGALAVVAQSGTDAKVGGPTFKKFTSVQVFGNIVGFLAQVAGGTGANKVTAATDLGVWEKNATDDLICPLREGDSINPSVSGSKKIKTLVSFAVGAGSPGQGRGWLTDPYGVYMTALAILDDKEKTQVVITGTENDPFLVSQSGSTTIGQPDVPGLTDETFKSYGLPASNNQGIPAFALLATLTPTAPVTKANGQGVFFAASNTFTPLARLTENAPGTGGSFSALKDPVLDATGGVAFPATIKGATIKGASALTLWWKPVGVVAASLLAQGGHTAGGVPGVGADAEWKSFNSLAIAATRGPIFTATLATGKGGVIAAQKGGTWAVDFLGGIRQLFQTGLPLDGGKTLKSFTILTAVPGSVGVTRSFNDAGDVTWLATFTDDSTAIVKTVVP